MLKQINWKVVFTCFAWVIALAGLVTLFSFINIKKRTVTCSDIKIIIPGADNFIEREEVDAILRADQGILLGRNLEQINIHKIEEKLKANPYIAFAKVYMDMDGVLSIEILQREPILRILNAGGQDFYIDDKGLKMPISSNFTANVLVATGNITEVFGSRVDTLHTQLARDLYKTAQYIKRDTLWDNQIEQIAVNDKKDMLLIPRVGDETIILGNADSLDVKMRNLKVFYKRALPEVIARRYKTISIKYSNQVVCEKRDSTGKSAKPKLASPTDSIRTQQKVADSLIRDVIGEALKTQKASTVPKKKEPVKPDIKKAESKVQANAGAAKTEKKNK